MDPSQDTSCTINASKCAPVCACASAQLSVSMPHKCLKMLNHLSILLLYLFQFSCNCSLNGIKCVVEK